MSLLAIMALLVGGCAGHSERQLTALTETEKAKVIEIALDTPEVKEWLEKESKYRAELVWVAINYKDTEPYERSWMRILDYDEIEEAAELVSEWTEVYPGVVIHFASTAEVYKMRQGEPLQFVVQVTVDLNTKKAVDVDMYIPLGERLSSKLSQ
jgi:hypothetical protein